jgi:hypothetical protein
MDFYEGRAPDTFGDFDSRLSQIWVDDADVDRIRMFLLVARDDGMTMTLSVFAPETFGLLVERLAVVPITGIMFIPGTVLFSLNMVVTGGSVWIYSFKNPEYPYEQYGTRILRIDQTNYQKEPVRLSGSFLVSLILAVHPERPHNLVIVPRAIEGRLIVYGPVPKSLVEGASCVSDGETSVRWNREDGTTFAQIVYTSDPTDYEFLADGSVSPTVIDPITAGEVYLLRNDGQVALGTFGTSSFSCRPFVPYVIQKVPLNRDNIETLLKTGEQLKDYCNLYGAEANDGIRCLCLDSKQMLVETFGIGAKALIAEGSIVSTARCFHEACSNRILDRGIPIYTTYSAYMSLAKCASRVTVCVPSLQAEGITGSAVSLVNNCGDGDTGDIITTVDGFPRWAQISILVIGSVLGLGLVVMIYRWWARRRRSV